VIVDLDQLDLDDRGGTSLPFTEVIESGAEVPFSRPAEGRMRFMRAGDVTWVRGEVGTEVTLLCARCARPFEHRLVGTFREGYRAGGAENEENEEEGSGAPVIVTLAASLLDVTEVVRQHLILAVPMAPLCRRDCRGLCPRCGADRNEGDCNCPADAVDPRLEVLRGFRPAAE
jgi:uncharacterized protein